MSCFTLLYLKIEDQLEQRITDDLILSVHNFCNCSMTLRPRYYPFFSLKKCSASPRDDKDQTHDLHSAPEIRDVFGDFDDDEEEDMGYAAQKDIEQDSNVSAMHQQ